MCNRSIISVQSYTKIYSLIPFVCSIHSSLLQKKMAEAVLITIGTSLASGLLKALLQKSVDALSESSSAAGLKSALFGNLKQELEKLETFLCCAESLNPVQINHNALMRHWLIKIKEAANFADNLLDDISYDQLRRQAESSNMVSNLLLYGSDGSFAFRVKIGRKLSKFKSMAAEIYDEAAKIGVKPVELVANAARYQPPAAMSDDLREIRENVDSSFVVGRQVDEDLIVGELARPNNDQVLGVIALVGMSGVGKTTMARKIYDNETVTEHYKKKVWIFVSQNFKLERLLDEMLQSLTVVSRKLSNTDAMEKKLRECLQLERYLLVLDDVWNTDEQVWGSIRSSLVRVTAGCTRSMVLVTTQSSDVASVMGAYFTHRVKGLSDDDAWALFEGKAFANKRQQQVLELRDVGRSILRKCWGLPLAINTLASLLGTMNERSQWESVDRSPVWKLSEVQTKIMPWLLLSFNYLPSAAIKRCFAHCSMFPKGSHLEAEVLINWWIAQGFIQLSEISDYPNMMDIRRMYIKPLLANNLLQSNDHTKATDFTMHDLIHDLAHYVSMNSNLIIYDSIDLDRASTSTGVEHVSIHGGNTFISLPNFPEGNTQSTLRTLICHSTNISIDLVAQARFLRQLHLISCGLKEIPSSIGGLKHLRYLQLDDNPFEYLPETIGKLYNLHVLTLLKCPMFVELPQKVTKLLNLRVIATTKAVHIPKGMGQLTSLTELPVLKLKAGDGCKITELRSLLHLRGRVNIQQLENMSSREDAINAGLTNREGITDMKLAWTSERFEDEIVGGNDEEVMEGLRPPPNLEFLEVENFRGKRFPQWLSNGLYCNNLTRLGLLNCKRCEQLPRLGNLRHLISLSIDGMESVEVIGRDVFDRVHSFKSLSKFKLLNMPKLKKLCDSSFASTPLPTEMSLVEMQQSKEILRSLSSSFHFLRELSIINCPSLVSAPSCFYSLQQLTVKGIDSGEPLLMILSSCTGLTSLIVDNVQRLTCLSEPLLKCSRLQLLRIQRCKELIELPPTLQGLGCLETLFITHCDSLTSLPDIGGALSLSRLFVTYCGNLTETPPGLQSCVSMKSFSFCDCLKLNTLIPDLSSLSRLEVLQVNDFSRQTSIPTWIQHFSSLYTIRIGRFNNELADFRGINHLPKCLKSLTLYGWPKLQSLPDDLASLTQIQILRLLGFDGVIALPEWLGDLSSLQSLELLHFRIMTDLPSSGAVRRLTRLRELVIEDCPKLKERCRRDGGEEWHKISHLPSIIYL